VRRPSDAGRGRAVEPAYFCAMFCFARITGISPSPTAAKADQ
jgi:hypothetical protein